jgi:hypothetical protein
MGYAVAQLDGGTVLQIGRSWVPIYTGSSEILHLLNISCSIKAIVSNRNEHMGTFLDSKDSRNVRLTTVPYLCAKRLEILGYSKSWSPQGLIFCTIRRNTVHVNVWGQVIYTHSYKGGIKR